MSLSLQSYTTNYWPGMQTTTLLVLHVNTDFLFNAKEKDLSVVSEAALIRSG